VFLDVFEGSDGSSDAVVVAEEDVDDVASYVARGSCDEDEI